MIKFPIYGKSKNHVPNHQPDINGIVDLPRKHGDFPVQVKQYLLVVSETQAYTYGMV
jgi:hypothetical protein